MSVPTNPTQHDELQDFLLQKLVEAQQACWRVFRIMAEFVEGFTLMAHQRNLVSVFRFGADPAR